MSSYGIMRQEGSAARWIQCTHKFIFTVVHHQISCVPCVMWHTYTHTPDLACTQQRRHQLRPSAGHTNTNLLHVGWWAVGAAHVLSLRQIISVAITCSHCSLLEVCQGQSLPPTHPPFASRSCEHCYTKRRGDKDIGVENQRQG